MTLHTYPRFHWLFYFHFASSSRRDRISFPTRHRNVPFERFLGILKSQFPFIDTHSNRTRFINSLFFVITIMAKHPIPYLKGILSQFPSRKRLLQSYSPRSLEIACQANMITYLRQESLRWWSQVQQHKWIPMITHYQKKGSQGGQLQTTIPEARTCKTLYVRVYWDHVSH